MKGKIFDYDITCEETNKPIAIGLKKKGYYDEKCKIISLRIGDILTIYIMKKWFPY